MTHRCLTWRSYVSSHCSYAKKKRKRGRARGNFIIGKKKGWGNKEDRLISKKWEAVIVSELMIGGKKIDITRIR